MAKKFQNLTVSYINLIGKMTINDRISMIRSDEGRQMIKNLTPYQLASMFPDYYKEKYPDVGKILKSISSPSFKPLSREEADRQMSEGASRIISRARAMPGAKPSWLRKLEEETGKTISDPSAKAQLSDIKKDLLKEMESKGIQADDPKAAFLKDLSDDDLKKAGIVKETDANGNTIFKRAEISQSEIQAEMEKTASAGVVKIVSAGQGQPTIVEYADGRVESRTGDRAWRNNNPGNLEYGDFAKKMGAIGSDGRFAIFPTPEAGREAKNKLLFEADSYRGLSIEKAISKYAPPNENDTEGYINKVTQSLGVPRNTNLSSLTPDQRKVMLDAIAKTEGGKPGKIEVLREGLGIANAQQPTEQQLAKIKEKIREKQETALAEKTDVPELPNGLDPGIVSDYNTMTPKQKQDFYSMLVQKSGGNSQEQIADGVKKVNETYQKGSASSVFVANNWQPGEPLPKSDSDAHKIIAETATGTLRYQGTVVDKAISMLGLHERGDREALKTYLRTGGKGSSVDPEKTPWCAAFVNASLAQSGIRGVRGGDELIATSYKNWGEAKQASEVAAGDVLVQPKGRNAGETGGHVGLSTGKTRIRNGELEIEMIGGNQSNRVSKQWLRASELEVRRARESDYDPRVLAEIKKGEDTQNTQLAVQNAEKSQPQIAEAPKSVVKPESGQAVEPILAEQTPQAQTQVQSQVQPQSQQTAQAQVQVQPQSQQTAQAQPQAQGQEQPVEVFAEGGTKSLDTTEIRAMPIKDLKGDNSVVIDKNDNPIFTMNTDKEHAKYDPVTKQVDIQPVEKPIKNDNLLTAEVINNSDKQVSNVNVFAEGGTQSLDAGNITPTMKTDPDQLGEQQKVDNADANQDSTTQENRQQYSQPVSMPSSGPRSGDVSVNITDELFKDPSFKRAIAKTRFVDTGDAALGGHFGMANADLG